MTIMSKALAIPAVRAQIARAKAAKGTTKKRSGTKEFPFPLGVFVTPEEVRRIKSGSFTRQQASTVTKENQGQVVARRLAPKRKRKRRAIVTGDLTPERVDKKTLLG